MKREKTAYPGVTFYTREDNEKVYYIRYRTGGRGTKETEEPVGTTTKGMTAAKASQIRAAKMAGKVETNKEKRAAKKAHKGLLTLKNLFERYQDSLPAGRGRTTDKGFFKRLKTIENKQIKDLVSKDVEQIQKKMEEEGKSPQTVKHVLNLITRTVNYGRKAGLLKQQDLFEFIIKKPTVDVSKTENMNNDTFLMYMKALNEEEDKECAAIIKIAVFTGMRKSAILSLRWENIDFKNKVIELEGKSAKNDKTAFIPLNANALAVFKDLKRGKGLIFPSPKGGGRREDFRHMARRVRDKAGLSKDFRPMHGLRHTYASMLASSGKVDMYTLQKLLTHKSPEMTQRYAHLSDEAMKRAASTADEIFLTIENEGVDSKEEEG